MVHATNPSTEQEEEIGRFLELRGQPTSLVS